MQRIAGGYIYSASDLNNDLECRRLTWLEYRLARGEIARPQTSTAVELIAEKGAAHEARFLDAMRDAHGDRLIAFDERIEVTRTAMEAADARTLEAMASGAPVIYQATFFDGTFLGRADFLRRVETPSARWAWSYEVVDTKLALHEKAHFLLQLCNYSEHLERLQGTPPAYGHLVLGTGLEAHFRIDDYAAYYRHQKRRFLERMQAPAESYPVEIAHCAICRWTEDCAARREADDYLGIVAGMRVGQIERLAGARIVRIGELAVAPDERRPFGMAEKTFRTLRAQAALQHHQRTTGQRVHELITNAEPPGFAQLPPPDEGDVYFDMEGDPLYTPQRGLEYLFGLHLARENAYRSFWALNVAEERVAFEALIDFLTERRRTYPHMHVYHYAPYETVALRRLMGVHGTREEELDALLRGEVFVDLYAVVRQSVRISQPSYSIKKIEPYYGMTRQTDVRRGDDSIVMFETWLANQDPRILADIEQYNNDDCRSTMLLHRWLLERREELHREHGIDVPWRPAPEPKETAGGAGADALSERLLTGLPVFESDAELDGAADDVRARWLLGNLLQYHRREAKPAWWKMFDRRDNPDRLTEFDHEAIGDLTLCRDVPPYRLTPRQNPIYTYTFPDQLFNLGGKSPYDPHTGKQAGDIIDIDADNNRLAIKLNGKIDPEQLRALIPGKPLPTEAQQEALRRVAASYEDGTIRERFPATLDIVLRALPRRTGLLPGMPLQPPQIDGDTIAAIIASLDRSYLFIQGPPGSGKSTTGGDAIAALIAMGKRVGVVSRGYAAVQNLIAKVEEAAVRRGIAFHGLHRHSSDDGAYKSRLAAPMIESTGDYGRFSSEPHELAAGTPWLFSRPELEGAYDVLFVDEAGQLALGDAVACATSARNVVLLGDPLQLAQVSQGAHPLGTGPSVLEHLLADRHTVPPERGVFLDVSYRMHPDICRFISHAVYDDRLHAAPIASGNRVRSPGFDGAGLRYLPVEHRNNARESAEEAERVAGAVDDLLRGYVTVRAAAERPMTPADILIVTPYNAQRVRIERALAARGRAGVRVGTVDKFQGQEAPVVLYSMATSSGDDMPRDLSFLLEKNRFNVAISRAQCLSILVCSPQLLEVRCRTPHEMQLASFLCAYVEANPPERLRAPL